MDKRTKQSALAWSVNVYTSVHSGRAMVAPRCSRDTSGGNTNTASSEQVPLPDDYEGEPTDITEACGGLPRKEAYVLSQNQ